MEASIITDLATGLGFPATVCIALIWVNRKTVEHYERLVLEFKNSIDNNTKVMNQLILRMGAKDNV